jgi:DNA end-binding protein Ku
VEVRSWRARSRPERYHDDYEEELRTRIKAKQRGKLASVEQADQPSAKVVDLMEALQASLDRGGARGKPRAASRPKKTATKTTKKATEAGGSRKRASTTCAKRRAS